MLGILKAVCHIGRPLMLGLLIAGPVMAQDAATRLTDVVQSLERSLDARVGVMIHDPQSGWSFRYREQERTLMNSTFKVLLCGAILKRVDAGQMALTDRVEISQADILRYAPVTKSRVGGAMTVADLCLATLDMSDNTAANLLIDTLGAPGDITAFLRDIGDRTTRVDRREPEMNIPGPSGMEDTSTPLAMAQTLEKLLVGNALSVASRQKLFSWMERGGVTGRFLRATAPSGWRIADKSGGGLNTRSILAMVSTEGSGPFFVAVYLSDAEVAFERRNAALAKVSAAIVDLLKER